MDVKVLDTNVLLHSPVAMNSFKDSLLIIPMTVLEELDNQKKRQDEAGRNARMTIKNIDRLQNKYGNEMILENGNRLRIEHLFSLNKSCGLDFSKPDNEIIAYALSIMEQGKNVTFVSNDGAARAKARRLGLKAESLEEDRINVPLDDVYKGWREIYLLEDEFNNLYMQKSISTNIDFLENEFIYIRNANCPTSSAIAKYSNGYMHLLTNQNARPWDIQAKNLQQRFLMEALLDTKIQLVTVSGAAGVGKSLLSIAAAGQQTIEDNIYKKMIVYKPVVPMGRDIGYLPGTEEEKLRPWMGSVYDSLEFILCGGQKYKDDNKVDSDSEIQYLIDKGYIELSALTFIRGRSRPNLFMIITEAQNLTPHEIKTIITRAGEGTKIVLEGDPSQIDNPFLDSQNNGLVYTIERLKGQELFAHITLEKPERSTLSALAADLL